jgi:hypothetical protein
MSLVRRFITQGPRSNTKRSTVSGPVMGPSFYPIKDFVYNLLAGVEGFPLLFWQIRITQVTLGKLA